MARHSIMKFEINNGIDNKEVGHISRRAQNTNSYKHSCLQETELSYLNKALQK